MSYKALASELKFLPYEFGHEKVSFLKHTAACLFFTKEALSGIQQRLGHRLHIVMSCAERRRVRKSPVTLKGAEISQDMFLTFKIPLLLF